MFAQGAVCQLLGKQTTRRAGTLHVDPTSPSRGSPVPGKVGVCARTAHSHKHIQAPLVKKWKLIIGMRLRLMWCKPVTCKSQSSDFERIFNSFKDLACDMLVCFRAEFQSCSLCLNSKLLVKTAQGINVSFICLEEKK